jgi:hypothetical protein
MFERFSRIAEQTATSVSRREFLGRFGRGAMIAAAAASGLLLPDAAHARRRPAVCGPGSVIYCQGLVAGAYCQIGTTGGTCVGAPDCTCRVKKPRGGR